jgi:hypothetical protein
VTDSLLGQEADYYTGHQDSLASVVKRGDGKHFYGNFGCHDKNVQKGFDVGQGSANVTFYSCCPAVTETFLVMWTFVALSFLHTFLSTLWF